MIRSFILNLIIIMSRSTELNVNPEVLRWAREESGYSVPDISGKLDIPEKQYQNWEDNGESIPFNTLKVISKTYKRQIAAFFLPEVPKKTKKPTDYRNIRIKGSDLSKDTLLSMRRANRFQDVLVELNGPYYYQRKYSWLSDFNKNFKDVALSSDQVTSWVRSILKYTIDDQIRDDSPESSYKNWREVLENELGIYVFQFSMPVSEVQGYSYADSYPYCLVINSKYHISSRIFTLFHELCHILHMQSGLCIPNDIDENQTIELKCNSFAGKVLLPNEVMVSTTDRGKIYKLSRKLKVSSEVYLRRLYSLDMISKDDFFYLLNEIRKATKPPKGGGPSTPLQKSINSRGHLLFNTVFDAIDRNRMSYVRASDILGVKINHLLSI